MLAQRSLLLAHNLQRVHEAGPVVVEVPGDQQELGVEQRVALLLHPHGHLAAAPAHPGGVATHFDCAVEGGPVVADLDVVDGARDDHDGRDEVAADVHALALIVEIGDMNWLSLKLEKPD